MTILKQLRKLYLLLSERGGISMITFWKLINDYKIKIPLIQRDYAQGRKMRDQPIFGTYYWTI